MYDGREAELNAIQEKLDALEYEMQEAKAKIKELTHECSQS